MRIQPDWRWLAVLILTLAGGPATAQQPTATLTGTVQTEKGTALEQAVIGIVGTTTGTTTNDNGTFRLLVPAGQNLTVEARRLGFVTQQIKVAALSAGQTRAITFRLPDTRKLDNVEVIGRNDATELREQASLTKIDPRITKTLPSPFGEFNRVLATLPGVQANNELSSTYNVRGGNFDENLIYVNGMEVYRPFLVTTGQQEGLSFVNPDLVEKIEFSSGGWQPRYGDKLSSVLAVEYKRPKHFGASATASITGGAFHIETPLAHDRLTFLAGVRYKDSRYVLRSLQTQGSYFPRFFDGQGYLTARLGPKADPDRTTLGILVSGARNDYRFEPQTRETTFGTVGRVIRLTVYFDGRERMQYDTWQSSLNLTHHFGERFTGELLGSYIRSDEREFRDVEAYYRFSDVNTNPDSKDYNQSIRQRDVGSEFNHSRNMLRVRLANTELRGTWRPAPMHRIMVGAKAGRERITDQLAEYGFIDSADYVIRPTGLFTTLQLPSERYQAYAQHTWEIDSARTLTYGVRAHYWSVNGQTTVSPRAQYSWRKSKTLAFRLATGLYQQPPFYRELRDNQGQLNTALRAQRSYHLIGGTVYEFKKWKRPFQLTTEVYAKYLTDVVPYDIDNVRLRYFAKNNATAYAFGADVRINGEFIKGAESWFSLGILSTRERITDSTKAYPNRYIRRPTDQRVQLGIMFQDHLPNNPSMRLQLFNVIGTGLPFSTPGKPEYRGTQKLSRMYWRTDIGFSKLLVINPLPAGEGGLRLRSLWLSFEVLNLLAKNNLVSYSYVQDINAVSYAVPNFLSQRLFNLRAVATF